MTKAEAIRINKLIMKKLTELSEEIGGEFQITGGDYNSETGEVSPKITYSSTTIENVEKINFERSALYYDLKASDFGRKLSNGMKIVGIATKNRKYPIIAASDDGKRYKLSIEQVKHFM